MPTDALPQPHPEAGPVEGSHCLRRTYRDALGRPMTGSVLLTGTSRSEIGNTVIPAAPVKVDLADGRLDVHLPPDTYALQASLVTADGNRITDTATVVLN